jgi:phenylpropionate dioxygenase-like ring-hydroxylating dioxygenase large terminal subunit
MEATRSASQANVFDAFKRYSAAENGFKNYWYPVARSSSVGPKPAGIKVLGNNIALLRSEGRVHALRNRCPHRGIPLSMGQSFSPGTLTCRYHGWTYDVSTGELVAVLTDTPDSAICGKATVRVDTFPAAELAGLVWLYIGDEREPPPLEAEAPAELLDQRVFVGARITRQKGNWRLAAEAGIDEGHARHLHRWSVWSLFRKFPVWTSFGMERAPDGWLLRKLQDKAFSAEYPRIGTWPQGKGRLRTAARGAQSVGIKLPGVVRVVWQDWTSFEYYIPIDEDSRIEVLLAVSHTRGLIGRLLFGVRFHSYINLLYNRHFHSQDNTMIEHMSIPPERLYGPDKAVLAWRRLCEKEARPQGVGSP